MLSKTNMIDMAGTKVRLAAWSPKNIFVNLYMFFMKVALLNMQYMLFFHISNHIEICFNTTLKKDCTVAYFWTFGLLLG